MFVEKLGKLWNERCLWVRFRAFLRFNALNTFPLKQKGKFPPQFLICLSPEDFHDAFCVAGVPNLDALVAVNQKANPAYP